MRRASFVALSALSLSACGDDQRGSTPEKKKAEKESVGSLKKGTKDAGAQPEGSKGDDVASTGTLRLTRDAGVAPATLDAGKTSTKPKKNSKKPTKPTDSEDPSDPDAADDDTLNDDDSGDHDNDSNDNSESDSDDTPNPSDQPDASAPESGDDGTSGPEPVEDAGPPGENPGEPTLTDAQAPPDVPAGDAADASSPDSGTEGTELPPPTLYYSFDAEDRDGALVLDLVGGFHGTQGAGVHFGSGVAGQAAVFAGENLSSSIVNDDVPKSGVFTVSLWLRADTLPGSGALRPLSLGAPLPDAPIGTGWAFGVNPEDVRFIVQSSGLFVATTPVTRSRWVHLVATVDVPRQRLQLFANAELQEEVDLDADDIPWGGAGLVLGYHVPTENRFFVGALDELVIWNDIVLDADAIHQVYDLGETGVGLPW